MQETGTSCIKFFFFKRLKVSLIFNPRNPELPTVFAFLAVYIFRGC